MASSNLLTSQFTPQGGRCHQREWWNPLSSTGLDRPLLQLVVELTEAALASDQPRPARHCLLSHPPSRPPLDQASAPSPEVYGWHLAECAADDSHHTAARVCLEEVTMVTAAGAEVVVQSIVHGCCCCAALLSTTANNADAAGACCHEGVGDRSTAHRVCRTAKGYHQGGLSKNGARRSGHQDTLWEHLGQKRILYRGLSA